jgi:hypothetical protein
MTWLEERRIATSTRMRDTLLSLEKIMV